MFEKILLPLDGSEAAEITLPFGEELARRLGSEVILFHVCGPAHKDYCRMHKVYLDKVADEVKSRIRKGRSQHGEIVIKAEALLGEPVETISDYVDQNDIGLMIMAASGASGFQLWRLGSVADKVFRTVCIPTLAIRTHITAPTRKKLISRILLPLDGSDASKMAVPYAEELANKLKASITLFQMARRVYPYVSVEGMGGITGLDYAKLDAAEEAKARNEVMSVEKEIKDKGISVTHHVALGIDPAIEIIELGQKVGADLVVMSTRGHSPITRWVLGSTAEKVLREGDLPLMLIRQACIV